MALDIEIDAEKFETLPDPIKAEYKESGGKYKLDVSGLEDTGALKRAKDHEVNAHRETKTKFQEAQARITELEKNSNRAEIDASWQSKLDTTKTEYEGKLGKLNGMIEKQTVTDVAKTIANAISTAPALLVPHIEARLRADLSGETPTTRILDKNGKESALTIEDLQKEFATNKDYSAIIRVSGASGGGAGSGGAGKGSAQGKFNGEETPNYAKMKTGDLVEVIKAKREARESK